MAKINLSVDQKIKLKEANQILDKFEALLLDSEFEFVVEGENMLLKTMDEKIVFRLVDLNIKDDGSGRDGVVVLPRTTDAQDLVPIRLNGKDL